MIGKMSNVCLGSLSHPQIAHGNRVVRLLREDDRVNDQLHGISAPSV